MRTKNYQFEIIIFLISILPTVIAAQDYSINLVNKAPLYATASIVLDYDDDGDLDIIITRRSATNDKEESSVELLENDASKQFPRTTLFEGLSSPVDLDMGDFNNDGNIDYAVSDRYVNTSSGALVLAINENNGTYSTSIIDDSIRTDQSAVADFDKNGNPDIVSVGFWREKVSIYWNDGSLNFTKEEITDTVIQVEIVEADDIDSDGDVDIIYGGGGLEGFKILYNNGSGKFDSSKTLYLNNGEYSNARGGLTIKDLNNDGSKDMLVFSGVGFGGMYFLDGSNDFSSSIIDIDGIDLGGDIVVDDIDGNGFKDIIRQNSGDDYLSILYQESELNFSAEKLELNWDNRGAGQMSLGDLDGDGDVDLVFPENGNVDGDISWFENIDGKLYRHYLYHEIEAVRIPLVADLDDDGDMDIIATAGDEGAKSEEDEIFWYENIDGSDLIEHRIDDDISYPGDIKAGDINGDGIKEVIATANEDSALVWYKKEGAGWLKILVDENLVNPLGCELVDLDSDDDLDIIVCENGDDRIILYKNNGSGIFTREVIQSSITSPQKTAASDFNSDGHLDIAVSCSDTNSTISLLINDGSGNFSSSVLVESQMSFDLEISDWNKDGAPDILASFDKGVLGDINRDIAVLINDGSAQFTDSSLVVLEERTQDIEIFDADNDGDQDIAIGSPAGIFPLRLGINENGAISSVIEIIDRGTRVYGLSAGDINMDGVMDLVASDQYQSTNNLLLFTGDLSTSADNIKGTEIPSKISLDQNYPNPFNPSTVIAYQIPQAVDALSLPAGQAGRSAGTAVRIEVQVTLKIYDILGREVATLVNQKQKPGNYEVLFNGSNYASGMYFYRLNVYPATNGGAGNYSAVKKMMLLK